MLLLFREKLPKVLTSAQVAEIISMIHLIELLFIFYLSEDI